jgi:hypothetical protein
MFRPVSTLWIGSSEGAGTAGKFVAACFNGACSGLFQCVSEDSLGLTSYTWVGKMMKIQSPGIYLACALMQCVPPVLSWRVRCSNLSRATAAVCSIFSCSHLWQDMSRCGVCSRQNWWFLLLCWTATQSHTTAANFWRLDAKALHTLNLIALLPIVFTGCLAVARVEGGGLQVSLCREIPATT